MNSKGGISASTMIIAATTTKIKVTNWMAVGAQTALCAIKVAR